MPILVKFAVPAGKAIDGLVNAVNKFSQSQGFRDFVNRMAAMSGPAITAIGDAIGHLAAAIGKFLLAIASPGSMAVFSGLIDGLAAALTGLGTAYGWLTKHVSPSLLHDIALGIVAIYTATKIWAVAQWALNVALDANPVGLVIAVVVALAFAIYEVVKHWNTVKGWWSDFWQFVVYWSEWAWHGLVKIWNDIVESFRTQFVHDMAHLWDVFWNNTIGRAIRGQQDLQSLISDLLHNIANGFDVFRHAVASIWDDVWNNTIGRAIRGWHDLMGVFGRLKTDVVNWFHDAVNWLASAGSNIISGLFNGIRSAMSGIGGWIKNNVVDPLVGAVKHFFGISSPATSMMPIGRNLIMGVIHGMLTSAKDIGGFIGKIFGGWPQALSSFVEKSLVSLTSLPGKALRALGSVAGTFVGGFVPGAAGRGVEQWLDITRIALMLNNLPDSLAGQVLYQMRTESGGNPNAINLTDINAQMGDPSRGLMQVIGSTFAAYHIPGTSGNIYDPLANIAAAINYAKHVYGPSLMSGGMGIGSGHGYDSGGWLPPGLTLAYNLTGSPELVLSQAQLADYAASMIYSRGAPSQPTYVAHFDSLTGAAIESHVRTAYQAMSITQGHLNRQGRRS
jgi:SLT domain-containing protein/phage-related protein